MCAPCSELPSNICRSLYMCNYISVAILVCLVCQWGNQLFSRYSLFFLSLSLSCSHYVYRYTFTSFILVYVCIYTSFFGFHLPFSLSISIFSIISLKLNSISFFLSRYRSKYRSIYPFILFSLSFFLFYDASFKFILS